MESQHSALIREKLTRLAESVDEISPYLRQPYGRYAGRKGDQRIVERLTQIIVEMASDTNDLLIANARGAPAPHARGSFEQVRDLGICPAALAKRFIGRYVRIRNLIVHQYDRLDTRALFLASRRLTTDAKAYITAVQRHLAQ